MTKGHLIGVAIAALLAAVPLMAATEPGASPNPLLAPWTGPYGGVPAFDKVRIEDFKPALEKAMADELAELDAIAGNPEKPTFANTIAAMESAGKEFDRSSTIFGIYSSTMDTKDFQAVETEMAPKLAEFGDKIVQNKALFARVAAVYDARESLSLTPEQKRLVWLDYTNFVHAGAKLGDAAQKRMSEINQRLATLFTKFSQNLLGDEADYVLYLERESDLAGLPDGFRKGASAAAETRGHKGHWAILNTSTSPAPWST
jgi:peptidyl-dipeptidase Dcp